MTRWDSGLHPELTKMSLKKIAKLTPLTPLHSSPVTVSPHFDSPRFGASDLIVYAYVLTSIFTIALRIIWHGPVTNTWFFDLGGEKRHRVWWLEWSERPQGLEATNSLTKYHGHSSS